MVCLIANFDGGDKGIPWSELPRFNIFFQRRASHEDGKGSVARGKYRSWRENYRAGMARNHTIKPNRSNVAISENKV